jgi:hypothetical protein
MLMRHDTGKRLGHSADRVSLILSSNTCCFYHRIFCCAASHRQLTKGFERRISLLARTHPFLTQTTTLLCSTILQVLGNDALHLPHRIIHGPHLLINLLVHPTQHP